MSVERKAFRTIYRLIADGAITEKEAFDLATAVFFVEWQFVPAPVTVQPDGESTPTDTPANEQITVKGFTRQ